MPRLHVITAASLLALTPALAHKAAPPFSLDGRLIETAWSSSADGGEVAYPGMIVGENCYVDQDVVAEPGGRIEQRLELICD